MGEKKHLSCTENLGCSLKTEKHWSSRSQKAEGEKNNFFFFEDCQDYNWNAGSKMRHKCFYSIKLFMGEKLWHLFVEIKPWSIFNTEE